METRPHTPKGSAWGKTLAWSKKKKKRQTIKILIFSICSPAVKVIYHNVYLGIIFKKSACILAIWQNILLDTDTGKDTFWASQQAYTVGWNRIKRTSEEIMEKELHSRSEYMKVELILFGMVHLDSRLCTFSHMYRKRSPFIVSPAHGKDQVSFWSESARRRDGRGNLPRIFCSSGKSPWESFQKKNKTKRKKPNFQLFKKKCDFATFVSRHKGLLVTRTQANVLDRHTPLKRTLSWIYEFWSQGHARTDRRKQCGKK